ncbi:hypothetical protein NM208_g13723 [Fusarium decemcellulare]|uniref:Uncharacterized protein n=1 Tax=Fusarium decemcellulare TaxID=57161 RepID=A0ACC1RIU2_9HYPO|nr:hypothetical protein NM208_g13723 [Fusarium decemcellulare]
MVPKRALVLGSRALRAAKDSSFVFQDSPSQAIKTLWAETAHQLTPELDRLRRGLLAKLCRQSLMTFVHDLCDRIDEIILNPKSQTGIDRSYLRLPMYLWPEPPASWSAGEMWARMSLYEFSSWRLRHKRSGSALLNLTHSEPPVRRLAVAFKIANERASTPSFVEVSRPRPQADENRNKVKPSKREPLLRASSAEWPCAVTLLAEADIIQEKLLLAHGLDGLRRCEGVALTRCNVVVARDTGLDEADEDGKDEPQAQNTTSTLQGDTAETPDSLILGTELGILQRKLRARHSQGISARDKCALHPGPTWYQRPWGTSFEGDLGGFKGRRAQDDDGVNTALTGLEILATYLKVGKLTMRKSRVGKNGELGRSSYLPIWAVGTCPTRLPNRGVNDPYLPSMFISNQLHSKTLAPDVVAMSKLPTTTAIRTVPLEHRLGIANCSLMH